MLIVKKFEFNPFGECTYVVHDSATRRAVVVDPGMVDAAERAAFDAYLADNDLTLTAIVNTHLHLDHCFGANYVRDRYGVPVRAHAADAPLGMAMDEQLRRFGLPTIFGAVTINEPLAEGDVVAVGAEQLRVLHVPGHSPGGIALYSPEGGFVLTGDSLFCGSIGRTDLMGGDYATLIRAVTDKLLALPDATEVLPGHGPSTTIATERHSNPYL